MLFSVAVFPVGNGPSLHKAVSEFVDEIDKAELHYEVNPTQTEIEGDWDDVMPVLQRAEERLRAHHDRVVMLITVDDYAGVENRMHTSVESVERELRRPVRH